MTQEAKNEDLRTLLRNWRAQRGKSQLELALDAGVSQRHISFVESGRSVPSRGLLLTLADALGIPLRERNLLLLAAGYAPVYQEPALDGPEMAIVAKAIDRMLEQHEPHPALVLDRYWHVLKTNEAAPKFFGQFVDLASRPRPRNLLHLILDPAGVRPFIENWQEVATGLLERVRREAVERVLDRQMLALLEGLQHYPGVRELPRTIASQSPVIPVHFVQGDRRWSYFSLVTTVGTPQNIAAQELRLECMFPG